LPVRGKVADGRVELEQADFQRLEGNRNWQIRNDFASGSGCFQGLVLSPDRRLIVGQGPDRNQLLNGHYAFGG
jgi:hypothetical protein